MCATNAFLIFGSMMYSHCSINRMSVEMIFEIGFNHACRNLTSNQSGDIDNLTIKFACNLLNEVTGYTENCLIEFFGVWARVLSFAGPGMDLKVVGELPSSATSTVWNDSVLVSNLSGPERIETRYTISKVIVVETNPDRPNRYVEFDKKGKLFECKTMGRDGNADFPNYWMDHKRKYVDKTPLAFRPLTTITADVAVINVAVAFLANSPPGPYKFSHSTAPYVRTHVQVCDLSFRQLRLSAIRAATDDVPCYHLHLQIDENVEPSLLPWLCVGDVLQVETVKPVFGQRQTWNLLHKQKNFGETKIKIWPIENASDDASIILDVQGKKSKETNQPPSEILELRRWARERLLKDSLLSDMHKGTLATRNEWFSGRDLVAKVEKINKYSNTIYITDFSSNNDDEPVEVRVRSSQQNFADALNYIFQHIERHKPTFNNLYVLLRNLRVNSSDNTLYCSVEHVTKVPEFCRDVQDLIKRREEMACENRQSQETRVTEASPSPATQEQSGFSFFQLVPTQWRNSFGVPGVEDPTQATQTGFADSNSQVALEFVDDEEVDNAENKDTNIASSEQETKRQRMGESA